MQQKSKLLQKAISKVVINLNKQNDTKYLKFCDENSISTSTYDNILNANTNVTVYTLSKIIKGHSLTFEQFGALIDKSIDKEFWEED